MGERGSFGVRADEAGLCLDALGIWLDPTGPRPLAFVSHAHATRAMGSGCVLASRETIAVARDLGQPLQGARAIGWEESVELPIGRAFGGGTARVSLAPAGHALGAAQLVVQHPRGCLVYAGDWGAEADGTHPAGVAVACDELIVTSTFALPIFRFEAHARTMRALVDFCAEQLADGQTPVVLAQSPGPAQAIARELIARGLPVAAHEDVRRAAAAYEALGVVIGPLGEDLPGSPRAAVLAPAGMRASALRRRRRAVVAYASGWALLDAALEQKRADAAFALADQADHDALLSLVRSSGATRVHATYGDGRALSQILRVQGVKADAFELPAIDERGAS